MVRRATFVKQVLPLAPGQEVRLITNMPLADARRRIAAFLKPLSNGELRGIQPVLATWEIDSWH